MTAPDALEQRIRAAVAKAIGAGWTIERGDAWGYGNPHRRTCCPLGALALVLGFPRLSFDFTISSGALANSTGVSVARLQAFARGFDGGPFKEFPATSRPYYDLGARLGVEFCGPVKGSKVAPAKAGTDGGTP